MPRRPAATSHPTNEPPRDRRYRTVPSRASSPRTQRPSAAFAPNSERRQPSQAGNAYAHPGLIPVPRPQKKTKSPTSDGATAPATEAQAPQAPKPKTQAQVQAVQMWRRFQERVANEHDGELSPSTHPPTLMQPASQLASQQRSTSFNKQQRIRLWRGEGNALDEVVQQFMDRDVDKMRPLWKAECTRACAAHPTCVDNCPEVVARLERAVLRRNWTRLLEADPDPAVLAAAERFVRRVGRTEAKQICMAHLNDSEDCDDALARTIDRMLWRYLLSDRNVDNRKKAAARLIRSRLKSGVPGGIAQIDGVGAMLRGDCASKLGELAAEAEAAGAGAGTGTGTGAGREVINARCDELLTEFEKHAMNNARPRRRRRPACLTATCGTPSRRCS